MSENVTAGEIWGDFSYLLPESMAKIKFRKVALECEEMK